MPLTVLKIKSITEPGKYYDKDGLYLNVKRSGRASWVYKFQLRGIKREMGLGPLRLVSLAEARQKALDCAKACYNGTDPLAAKRKLLLTNINSMSFRDAATHCIAAKAAGWSNQKHTDQWTRTFELHARPMLGDTPIAAIDSEMIVRTLEKIWYRQRRHRPWSLSHSAPECFEEASGLPPAFVKPSPSRRLNCADLHCITEQIGSAANARVKSQ